MGFFQEFITEYIDRGITLNIFDALVYYYNVHDLIIIKCVLPGLKLKNQIKSHRRLSSIWSYN